MSPSECGVSERGFEPSIMSRPWPTGGCCAIENKLSLEMAREKLVIGYSFLYTRSLTLREERRLRVFENRVLRRVFGPKRDDVTREWRKQHNEELNDLYSLPNIVRVVKSRRMSWAGHVARMGEDRGVHRWFGGEA